MEESVQPVTSDHATIAFFRTRLNRIAVSKEIKKDVNATIDFFLKLWSMDTGLLVHVKSWEYPASMVQSQFLLGLKR